MAEVIFPAVPVNGGAVGMTHLNSHMCRMSDTRFLTVFNQATPYYFIAQVFDVNNMRSATPTPTAVKQNILLGIAPVNVNAQVRLVRLSSTRALMLYSSALNVNAIIANVLEIGATGEVTVKLTTDIAVVTMAGGIHYQGCSYLTTMQASENTALVSVMLGPADTNGHTYSLVYNEATNVLTSTNIHSFTVNPTFVSLTNLTLVKVPTGGVQLVAACVSGGNYASVEITKVYHYANDLSVTSVLDRILTYIGNNQERKTYVPFTESTGVLTNGTHMSYLSNKNTSQPVAINNALGNANCTTFDSVYLGDGFFATLGFSYNEDAYNVTRFFRVVKYTDPNFAECSPATTGDGTNKGSLIVGMHQWYVTEQCLDLVAPDLIVIAGLSSPAAFGLRTLWLPSL